MSESKGSRNVSLGPYRSTELRLENRLTKEEAREVKELVRGAMFGLIPKKDCNYDLETIDEMVSALGYEKRTIGFFVKGNEFVYLSGYDDDNFQFVSGNYEGNLEGILSDVSIINDMHDWNSKFLDSRSIANYNLLGCAGLISFVTDIGLVMSNLSINVASIILAAFSSAVAVYGFKKAEDNKPNLKMLETASFLSKDASKYSFGKEVYNKIIEEYYELTRPEQPEAPLFELPESKENKE